MPIFLVRAGRAGCRSRIGRLLGLAMLLVAASRVCRAADPGLAGVDDILRGRRQLLSTDDLVVTNPVWQSNLGTVAEDLVLDTADGQVSSAQTATLRSATCGVDAARNGANKAFPQQTQIARLLDQKNDVIVSMFASNNAYGDGCLGGSNLQIKVIDTQTNQLVGSGFYTLATLEWLESVVADFDGDGLDDVLVINGDQAFVVSAPYSGTTSVRTGPFTSTGASRTPMGEPVVGDFNGDGLRDVAWPAATLTNGSPDGSAISIRFATVCPGSVAGTICDGRQRFEIVLDPLSSTPITLQSTQIVWERTITCSAQTSNQANETFIPLVALAAGDFSGADRDVLFAAYATALGNANSGYVSSGIQAKTYAFDAAMRPTQISNQVLATTTYVPPTQGFYAASARLDWFGSTSQVVLAWGAVDYTGDSINNLHVSSETHVSVITFDGSLKMTSHETTRTLRGDTDHMALLRGLAVGRFSDLSSDAQASDFDPQIAVLLVNTYQSAACPSKTTNATSYIDFYSLDAFSGDYTPSLSSTYQACVDYNPTTTVLGSIYLCGGWQGWNTGGSLLRAGDLQGRSVRVGTPLVLRESSHSQPFVILGAPPSHVDYVQAAGATASAVVNFSALPADFTARFDTATQSTNQSANTETTSYSQARMSTDSLGVKLDVPMAGSVLGTTSRTTTATYENLVSTEYDTYTASSFDISTTTQGDDYLWFNATGFNAYFYPVVGQTVCSGNTTSCSSSDQVPLMLAFSGPEETRTEAIAGSVVEWYQPVEEPLQIFSYPWSEQQLEQRVPQAEVLSQTLAFFTDSSDVTESLQWSDSQGSDTTAGTSVTHGTDTSRSITVGSPDLTYAEGSAASASRSVSYSKSTSLSTLNTNVTVAGGSSGVEIVKPGTFANPRLYAYLVAPYILGETPSSGTVQDIATDTDVATTGALQVAYVANPTDGNAGSWWEGGAYAQYVDVALNHPARWTLSYTGQDTSVQGAECLINEDHFTVSCARINDPDASDLWNSEFYWMRGLLVTVGGTGGPQRTQATAGESVYLSARVYNYSLKAMPSDSTVHVRFYRQPWDTSTQSPAGDSVLIAENVVDPISPFNSATDPTAANWVLTSASFDTTDLGGSSMIFWVLVWAEDGSGNLLGELPGHGLSAKPDTLRSIADVPLEQVTYPYEGEQLTSSFSNNVGFFHLAFYVSPATEEGASAVAAAQETATDRLVRPLAHPGSLVLERLSDRPIVTKRGEKVALDASLRSPERDRDGILVILYDGDPDAGAKAFEAEMVGHVARGMPYRVRVPHRPQVCGARNIVMVANHGKADEARVSLPLTAVCEETTPTPTASATPTPTVHHRSDGGGCAIGPAASQPAAWLPPFAISLLLSIIGALNRSRRRSNAVSAASAGGD